MKKSGKKRKSAEDGGTDDTLVLNPMGLDVVLDGSKKKKKEKKSKNEKKRKSLE